MVEKQSIDPNNEETDQRYFELLADRQAEIIDLLEQIGDAEAPDEDLSSRLSDGLKLLYDADLSDLLEIVKPQLRYVACDHLRAERLIEVLNDMSEESLVALLEKIDNDLLAKGMGACENLETVEGVIRCLAPKRRTELLHTAGLEKNVQLLQSLTFAPDSVGELLEINHIAVSSNLSLAQVQQRIAQLGDLPHHTDKLFVTEDKVLTGVLPLKYLMVNPPEALVKDTMVDQRLHTLTASMDLEEAIGLFERYDLVSAPVLNNENEVIGRITVDELLKRMLNAQHSELLSSSGVQDEEDIHASLWRKFQNRGFWIFLNLLAAMMISQVIGNFKDTLLHIIALATLMPVVGNLAGNAGMQTSTLIIRSLIRNQISRDNWYMLLLRELLLAMMNGLFWGSIVGIITLLLHHDVAMGLVLAASMTLVFVVAVACGFFMPILVKLLRGDPALGTAVMVTTLTDCIGFAIFLGLATIFLL